jgi:pilus assembly protein CpaF
MEIMECEILPDNSRRYRTLFQYEISENRYENNQFHISGDHVTVNPVSDSLCKRLLENGMPQERINAIKKGGKISA